MTSEADLTKIVSRRKYKLAFFLLGVFVFLWYQLIALYIERGNPREAQVILVSDIASDESIAITERLLKAGHIVYGISSDETADGWLNAAGGHTITINVASDASITAGLSRIMKERGRLDVLLLYTDETRFGSFEETSLTAGEEHLVATLWPALRLTHHALPRMREAAYGRIIIHTNGSTAHTPLGSWHHISRQALLGLGESLRHEVKQFGIAVSLVESNAYFSQAATVDAIANAADTQYTETFAVYADAKTASSTDRDYNKLAEQVTRIVQSKQPKPHYYTTLLPHGMDIMRAILGERVYDWLVVSLLKI